jgi:hypothetical protein
MNRTHPAVYVKCTGTNFSAHRPTLLGSVSVGERLEDMRPAPGAQLELMADEGDSIPDANRSSAEFKREGFEDVEYFVVEQLEVKVPAYGRIHQAIPA